MANDLEDDLLKLTTACSDLNLNELCRSCGKYQTTVYNLFPYNEDLNNINNNNNNMSSNNNINKNNKNNINNNNNNNINKNNNNNNDNHNNNNRNNNHNQNNFNNNNNNKNNNCKIDIDNNSNNINNTFNNDSCGEESSPKFKLKSQDPIEKAVHQGQHNMYQILQEMNIWQLGIAKEDGLSQYICSKCIAQFYTIHKFRKKCVKVQLRLRQVADERESQVLEKFSILIDEYKHILIPPEERSYTIGTPLVNEDKLKRLKSLTILGNTHIQAFKIWERPIADSDYKNNTNLNTFLNCNVESVKNFPSLKHQHQQHLGEQLEHSKELDVKNSVKQIRTNQCNKSSFTFNKSNVMKYNVDLSIRTKAARKDYTMTSRFKRKSTKINKIIYKKSKVQRVNNRKRATVANVIKCFNSPASIIPPLNNGYYGNGNGSGNGNVAETNLGYNKSLNIPPRTEKGNNSNEVDFEPTKPNESDNQTNNSTTLNNFHNLHLRKNKIKRNSSARNANPTKTLPTKPQLPNQQIEKLSQLSTQIISNTSSPTTKTTIATTNSTTYSKSSNVISSNSISNSNSSNNNYNKLSSVSINASDKECHLSRLRPRPRQEPVHKSTHPMIKRKRSIPSNNKDLDEFVLEMSHQSINTQQHQPTKKSKSIKDPATEDDKSMNPLTKPSTIELEESLEIKQINISNNKNSSDQLTSESTKLVSGKMNPKKTSNAQYSVKSMKTKREQNKSSNFLKIISNQVSSESSEQSNPKENKPASSSKTISKQPLSVSSSIISLKENKPSRSIESSSDHLASQSSSSKSKPEEKISSNCSVITKNLPEIVTSSCYSINSNTLSKQISSESTTNSISNVMEKSSISSKSNCSLQTSTNKDYTKVISYSPLISSDSIKPTGKHSLERTVENHISKSLSNLSQKPTETFKSKRKTSIEKMSPHVNSQNSAFPHQQSFETSRTRSKTSIDKLIELSNSFPHSEDYELSKSKRKSSIEKSIENSSSFPHPENFELPRPRRKTSVEKSIENLNFFPHSPDSELTRARRKDSKERLTESQNCFPHPQAFDSSKARRKDSTESSTPKRKDSIRKPLENQSIEDKIKSSVEKSLENYTPASSTQISSQSSACVETNSDQKYSPNSTIGLSSLPALQNAESSNLDVHLRNENGSPNDVTSTSTLFTIQSKEYANSERKASADTILENGITTESSNFFIQNKVDAKLTEENMSTNSLTNPSSLSGPQTMESSELNKPNEEEQIQLNQVFSCYPTNDTSNDISSDVTTPNLKFLVSDDGSKEIPLDVTSPNPQSLEKEQIPLNQVFSFNPTNDNSKAIQSDTTTPNLQFLVKVPLSCLSHEFKQKQLGMNTSENSESQQEKTSFSDEMKKNNTQTVSLISITQERIHKNPEKKCSNIQSNKILSAGVPLNPINDQAKSCVNQTDAAVKSIEKDLENNENYKQQIIKNPLDKISSSSLKQENGEIKFCVKNLESYENIANPSKNLSNDQIVSEDNNITNITFSKLSLTKNLNSSVKNIDAETTSCAKSSFQKNEIEKEEIFEKTLKEVKNKSEKTCVSPKKRCLESFRINEMKDNNKFLEDLKQNKPKNGKFDQENCQKSFVQTSCVSAKDENTIQSLEDESKGRLNENSQMDILSKNNSNLQEKSFDFQNSSNLVNFSGKSSLTSHRMKRRKSFSMEIYYRNLTAFNQHQIEESFGKFNQENESVQINCIHSTYHQNPYPEYGVRKCKRRSSIDNSVLMPSYNKRFNEKDFEPYFNQHDQFTGKWEPSFHHRKEKVKIDTTDVCKELSQLNFNSDNSIQSSQSNESLEKPYCNDNPLNSLNNRTNAPITLTQETFDKNLEGMNLVQDKTQKSLPLDSSIKIFANVSGLENFERDSKILSNLMDESVQQIVGKGNPSFPEGSSENQFKGNFYSSIIEHESKRNENLNNEATPEHFPYKDIDLNDFKRSESHSSPPQVTQSIEVKESQIFQNSIPDKPIILEQISFKDRSLVNSDKNLLIKEINVENSFFPHQSYQGSPPIIGSSGLSYMDMDMDSSVFSIESPHPRTTASLNSQKSFESFERSSPFLPSPNNYECESEKLSSVCSTKINDFLKEFNNQCFQDGDYDSDSKTPERANDDEVRNNCRKSPMNILDHEIHDVETTINGILDEIQDQHIYTPVSNTTDDFFNNSVYSSPFLEPQDTPNSPCNNSVGGTPYYSGSNASSPFIQHPQEVSIHDKNNFDKNFSTYKDCFQKPDQQSGNEMIGYQNDMPCFENIDISYEQQQSVATKHAYSTGSTPAPEKSLQIANNHSNGVEETSNNEPNQPISNPNFTEETNLQLTQLINEFEKATSDESQQEQPVVNVTSSLPIAPNHTSNEFTQNQHMEVNNLTPIIDNQLSIHTQTLVPPSPQITSNPPTPIMISNPATPQIVSNPSTPAHPTQWGLNPEANEPITPTTYILNNSDYFPSNTMPPPPATNLTTTNLQSNSNIPSYHSPHHSLPDCRKTPTSQLNKNFYELNPSNIQVQSPYMIVIPQEYLQTATPSPTIPTQNVFSPPLERQTTTTLATPAVPAIPTLPAVNPKNLIYEAAVQAHNTSVYKKETSNFIDVAPPAPPSSAADRRRNGVAPSANIVNLICRFCHVRLRFTNNLDYSNHIISTHPVENPFNCPYCPCFFTRRHKREKHILEKHSSNRFQCAQCDQIFSAQRGLDTHLQKAHAPSKPTAICKPQLQQTNDQTPHQFSDMGDSNDVIFVEEVQLDMTNEPKQRKGIYLGNEQSDILQNPPLPERNSRILCCPDCADSSENGLYPQRLCSNHQTTNSGQTPMAFMPSPVQVEPDSTSTAISLRQYRKRRTSQNNAEMNMAMTKANNPTAGNFNNTLNTSSSSSSVTTNILATSRSSKSIHNQILISESRNTLPSSHNCIFCEETFTNDISLKKHHQLAHGNQPTMPYTCSVCKRGFRMRTALQRHMEAHEVEGRPYECDLCHVRFPRPSQLTLHKLSVHYTKKPFACNDCGKQFVTETILRTHMKFHGERKFKCNICNRMFVHQKDLRKHQRIHTGERFYKCDFCDKSFVHYTRLIAHVRTHVPLGTTLDERAVLPTKNELLAMREGNTA